MSAAREGRAWGDSVKRGKDSLRPRFTPKELLSANSGKDKVKKNVCLQFPNSCFHFLKKSIQCFFLVHNWLENSLTFKRIWCRLWWPAFSELGELSLSLSLSVNAFIMVLEGGSGLRERRRRSKRERCVLHRASCSQSSCLSLFF